MKTKIERISPPVQLDEDIDLHVTGWVVQRIGWSVMFIFLCLAVFGFFGDGMLSEKTITIDGVTISFERFLRRESNSVMEINASSVNGKIELLFSPDFNKTYQIEAAFPEPAEQSIRNNATLFTFRAEGQGQITLFLNVRKETIGRVTNSLSVNQTDFTLSHYVFP